MVDFREIKTRNRCKGWKWSLLLILLLGAIIVLAVDLALKPEPAEIDHNWVFLEEMRLAGFNLSSSSSRLAASNSTAALARPSNSSKVVGAITTVLRLSNPNLSGKLTYYDAASFVFFSPDGGGGADEMVAAGRAAIVPGAIKPQGRRNISATVHTEFDVPRNSSSLMVLLATETNLTGFVYKWFVFKHHFTLSSSCWLHVSPANDSLVSYLCNSG